MEPIFQLATSSDLDILLELMREYYEFDRLPFQEFKARRAMSALIRDSSLGRVWLIRLGADAIGYTVLTLGHSMEYGGRDAFIDELFLRPHHRGRGWGKKTMEFVEKEASSLGVHALHLEVTRDNATAQALYRRLGFADHDRYLMTKLIGK